ncbi:hypothetical protein [Marinimicrobium alkaliphilum]|uniref:hypothetical protein n=1 Tax=Marinimicrobium alkaliphilum TaxID=2202654 RepID=UPI0013008AE9|nr:hypothetical protein [Marinimicrobium alkaliphilum]
MHYSDGNSAALGDQVLLSGTHHGVVVSNIDDDEYSTICPKENWTYLGSGVIIDTDFGGLVHYEQASLTHENIELEHRAKENF